MNKVQSALLTQFYRELQAWIDAGTPHERPFSVYPGICVNLWEFARLNKITYKRAEELEGELQDQFERAGLDKSFPFNFGDDDYRYESDNGSRWKNSDRLEWIRKHAKL